MESGEGHQLVPLSEDVIGGGGILPEVSDELMRLYRRKGWHDEFARYVE